METVEASLSIELNVTCPECDNWFDLVSETDLNDEGLLLDQTIKDERWKVPANERLECKSTCPECGADISVMGVAW